MRRLAVLSAVVGLVCVSVGVRAEKTEVVTKVGVTTRVFHPKEPVRNWRGATPLELKCVIWYPAVAGADEVKQFVGPPGMPLFEAGMAAPEAALAAPRVAVEKRGGWPLVLLSHGTGGSAMQMAWLGTALARAGFIAVAVDHPGNNSNGKMTPEGMALWWERATDLSQVLDMMLADELFGKQIDQARVGAAGYSIGGYTVMELGGARTDVSELLRACRQDADMAVCHVPEARGMGGPEEILPVVRKTSAESLARSDGDYSDERVGAVFAIAPALGFTQTEDSLHAMKLPVELVVGDLDKIAPVRDNAGVLYHDVRGAKLTVLPKVGHYTFLDSCTVAGAKAFPLYCEDDRGVERDAIHAKVAAMAVAFFRRSLRVR
jgi:predicted dienelactone hydrolase